MRDRDSEREQLSLVKLRQNVKGGRGMKLMKKGCWKGGKKGINEPSGRKV